MRYVVVPRVLAALLLGLGLVAPLAPPPPVAAQAEERCFPETGQCLAGRFRQFWEQNGGLAAFGFPITPARPEVNRDTGATYLTQWFERNGFELHPENQPPYDVLLGRLGDDRLRQLGIDWRTLPGDDTPLGDCRPFPETGHRLCNQGGALGFRHYWETHGLDLGDLGVSEREALALLGLPLTRVREETNASGDRVLAQWFERARLEWHPGNSDEFKVLLGLLGREVSQAASAPAAPTPTPAPTPPVAPAGPRLGPFGPIVVEAGGRRVVRPYARASWTDTSDGGDTSLPAEALDVAAGDPVIVEFDADLVAGGEDYRGPAAVGLAALATPRRQYRASRREACPDPTSVPTALAGRRAASTADLPPGNYALCFLVRVDASAANPQAGRRRAPLAGEAVYVLRLAVREVAAPPAQPPAACPALASPPPGATLDNGRGDRLDSVVWEFDWSECPGATAYGLYVIKAGADIPVIDQAIPSSAYRSDDRGAYIADQNRRGWSWRVRAWANGQWGAWSETRSFDVEPVNSDQAAP